MKTKVEILQGEGKPDLTLEPFFRTREESRLIRLLQSAAERKKYAVYFEWHGCYKCGRRDLPHAAHAHCTKCYRWAQVEFERITKEIERGEV